MNEVMTESEFRKRIKFGIDAQMQHVFFFFGEEDYLKHAAVETAKASVVADASFDYVRIGAAEYSEEALLSAIAAPPMFGDYRLVTVSVSFRDLRPGEVNGLLSILGDVDPEGYTVLLLSLPADGFDPGVLPKKPSATFKKLAEIAVPVQFDRVTGAKLNGWVSKHYSQNKLLADAQVCAYTVNYCGTDMFRLASEIDKISCYVLSKGRDRVTPDDVRAVGSTTVEFDAFAMANAIIAGNKKLALNVLAYAKTQKTEPVAVMAEISTALCNLAAVDACRKAGMSSQKISELTGLRPYPVTLCLNALETMDTGRLKKALDAAKIADAGVKGYAKDYIPIERLICSM